MFLSLTSEGNECCSQSQFAQTIKKTLVGKINWCNWNWQVFKGRSRFNYFSVYVVKVYSFIPAPFPNSEKYKREY